MSALGRSTSAGALAVPPDAEAEARAALRACVECGGASADVLVVAPDPAAVRGLVRRLRAAGRCVLVLTRSHAGRAWCARTVGGGTVAIRDPRALPALTMDAVRRLASLELVAVAGAGRGDPGLVRLYRIRRRPGADPQAATLEPLGELAADAARTARPPRAAHRPHHRPGATGHAL
ncbi:hypothetical protein [Coralloluteibacterium thermophilus]|uniref:Uncharacterized protein n=1 Tax=Coralloluteibacterium thermophilum TaxID=2707049 RepID=A0ABV9NFY7_9GAMM